MDSTSIIKNSLHKAQRYYSLIVLTAAVIGSLLLSGCSRENPFVGGSGASFASPVSTSDRMYEQSQSAPAASSPAVNANRDQFLAYIHRLSVELTASAVFDAYKNILKACAADSENACSVLRSNLSAATATHSGHANITLRIKPEGVGAITKLANEAGETVSQGTEAEDLRDAITDTQKRIAMLESYRERLLLLEKKPDIAIDALIKVASEISTTQNQLEAAAAQKSQLMRRVQLDIVEITLFSESNRSPWSPLQTALKEFSGNLTYAASRVITTVAVLIPWSILLLFILLMLRIVWRFLRRKQ